MSKSLMAQKLIYKINSLVDKGETISLEEIEELSKNKNVIDFLEEKFEEIKILNINGEDRELIETELKNHSFLFEVSTSQKYYGISKNGYLMLSSALVNLMVENVL